MTLCLPKRYIEILIPIYLWIKNRVFVDLIKLNKVIMVDHNPIWLVLLWKEESLETEADTQQNAM